MGGDDSGCDIGLLGVTSNKLVTFPRQNSIRPSSSCCSVWGMQLLHMLAGLRKAKEPGFVSCTCYQDEMRFTNV